VESHSYGPSLSQDRPAKARSFGCDFRATVQRKTGGTPDPIAGYPKDRGTLVRLDSIKAVISGTSGFQETVVSYVKAHSPSPAYRSGHGAGGRVGLAEP
jgi:hypothetical protein